MHTLKKEVHDLREDYNENGVVVIKNVLNNYWLEVLQEAIEIQVQEKKRYFDNRNMQDAVRWFQRFLS